MQHANLLLFFSHTPFKSKQSVRNTQEYKSPENHWSEQVDIKKDVKAVQVSVRHLSERFCFLDLFSRSLIFIQSSSPTTLPPALNLLRVLMKSERSPKEVSAAAVSASAPAF